MVETSNADSQRRKLSARPDKEHTLSGVCAMRNVDTRRSSLPGLEHLLLSVCGCLVNSYEPQTQMFEVCQGLTVLPVSNH